MRKYMSVSYPCLAISTRHSRYLNFEGADEPSEGPYATSIPLMHAMNRANDVMLVFGQNGRVLHPDHGYVCPA